MSTTNIKLHGVLGEQVGKKEWNLKVSSVSEALRAIEVLSKHKLYKNLLQNDTKSIKYRVLINGRDFETDKPLDNPNDLKSICNCELVMNFKELKSIDIIPILSGAGGDGTWAVVIGALLIVIGVILIATGLGAALGTYMVIAGIGLLAAGVTALLTSPPKFEDFREVQGGGRTSYLFSGPQNTTREGGPVPIGYGRMLVGSQVLSASYEISHINADSNPLTS